MKACLMLTAGSSTSERNGVYKRRKPDAFLTLGAALTTLFSYSLYPVMIYWVSKRHLRWVIPWRSLGNILVAAVVAGAAWAAMARFFTGGVIDWLVLVVAGAAGLVVYGLVLLLLRELKPYERQLLVRRIGAIGGKTFRRD